MIQLQIDRNFYILRNYSVFGQFEKYKVTNDILQVNCFNSTAVFPNYYMKLNIEYLKLMKQF